MKFASSVVCVSTTTSAFINNSPSANEVRPVQHYSLRQRYLGLRVVPRKVIEAANKRSAEEVRQVLTVNATLAL